jgi:hypothetical protein
MMFYFIRDLDCVSYDRTLDTAIVHTDKFGVYTRYDIDWFTLCLEWHKVSEEEYEANLARWFRVRCFR